MVPGVIAHSLTLDKSQKAAQEAGPIRTAIRQKAGRMQESYATPCCA